MGKRSLEPSFFLHGLLPRAPSRSKFAGERDGKKGERQIDGKNLNKGVNQEIFHTHIYIVW